MKHFKPLLAIIFFLYAFITGVQSVQAADLPNPYSPKWVGQCTWYAAEMRPDLRFNIGNAASWATVSTQHGYIVDTTPEIGSIAVWAPNIAGAFGNGHVAHVINITDATHFRVQEYNWTVPLGYGERQVTWANGIQFIHTSGYKKGGATSTPPTLPDPVISYIYSIAPGSAQIGDKVTITLGAQDTAGRRNVTSIIIYLNNQQLGSVNGSSGSYTWTTNGYQPGTYNFSFRAQITGWTGSLSQKQVSYVLQNGTSSGGSSPSSPALSTPSNGAGLPLNTQVILTWNTTQNASQYKVELWGGNYNTITPCDWQSNTTCTIGTMWPGYTYSWHVKAKNSNNQESDWSSTWNFTIQGPTATPPPPPTITPTSQPQAPASPALQDPVNKANYPQSQDISFAWNYSSGATDYYLEYWGGPYGTLNSGWIKDIVYHIGTMWPGKYHWHVKGRGSNGQESNWSDTWIFTIAESASATSLPPIATAFQPTPIPPTAIQPTPIPPTPIPPTAAPPPKPGFVELVDDLTLHTDSGTWPPQSGQKLIAHIKIRNGGDQPIHIEHIGVRGRRNGSDFWDIGFWSVDLNGHDVWSLDPNNERPLVPGNYSFRISYSLDGSNWKEVGNEINFSVP